jgi:rRNA maturation RNase YbeY
MDIEVFNLDPLCALSTDQIANIVNEVTIKTDSHIKSCNIIFLSDRDLAEMHNTFLNDPSPTDVITFNLGNEKIEGEIYISSERAKAQSREYNVSFENEIIRLVVHGLLHLAGYDDLSESDYKKMKQKENYFVEYFTA